MKLSRDHTPPYDHSELEGVEVATAPSSPSNELDVGPDKSNEFQDIPLSTESNNQHQNQDATVTKEWSSTDIPVVPWLRQLAFCLRKNNLLIVRRPILLGIMVRECVGCCGYDRVSCRAATVRSVETVRLTQVLCDDGTCRCLAPCCRFSWPRIGAKTTMHGILDPSLSTFVVRSIIRTIP